MCVRVNACVQEMHVRACVFECMYLNGLGFWYGSKHARTNASDVHCKLWACARRTRALRSCGLEARCLVHDALDSSQGLRPPGDKSRARGVGDPSRFQPWVRQEGCPLHKVAPPHAPAGTALGVHAQTVCPPVQRGRALLVVFLRLLFGRKLPLQLGIEELARILWPEQRELAREVVKHRTHSIVDVLTNRALRRMRHRTPHRAVKPAIIATAAHIAVDHLI